ncbi:hypothetical protein M413DRAFT_248711 [Hebeloma cylindrosporum]|uniref:Uncharacterized protein n=1 Tax=Hebeloma cylindrosporum TaxID=76867 RepID=A0A0C3C3U9_HEBCY|nr:hypothetical protein M413DRAFT_248711 [Hebeloma cylindrosporum h7]
MVMPCARCTKTAPLRPERCTALDGEPCSACICSEDIELEKSIEEMEAKIEKIYTKRRALRTVMNENHDQLISQFPPEITSQIFTYYSQRDENDTKTPFYLGAVCRKWRHLAWTTPRVWSSLAIKFYSPQLLVEHLERSAPLPLTITLFPTPYTISEEIFLEAINILNEHSSRWHTLNVALPARHLHRLCGSLEGNTLQKLVLRPDLNQSPERRDVYNTARFSMKCKPSPIHVVLQKYRLPNVDIVWNHLTTASMEDVALDECFELMRRAPLLECLSLFEIIPSSGVFPIPTERIKLPLLRFLGIWENEEYEGIVAKMLDSICAPSLKSWNIRDSSSLNNIVSFIDQSSFSLERFKVGGNQPFYDQVHTILSRLSSLQSLILQFPFERKTTTEDILRQLCTSSSSSDESSHFLPRLQTLEFIPKLWFPWESLSRIPSSSTRRSLAVTVKINTRNNLNLGIPDRALEKLVELVDAGFKLSILEDDKVDVLARYRKERARSAK